MTLHGDWGGVIAQDSHSIVGAAVSLYQQQELWQQAQRSGFAIVQEKFSLAKHETLIWQQLNGVMQQLEHHRQANFTGLMLRHHNYRSTKFMGQWIEAKTRLAALTQPD